jgi:hypothetical protein
VRKSDEAAKLAEYVETDIPPNLRDADRSHGVLSSEFRRGQSLVGDFVFGAGMLALGCISMWLCFRAWQKAARKWLVLAYAAVLAPFAFGIPAWMIILIVLFKSGRYHGPMP